MNIPFQKYSEFLHKYLKVIRQLPFTLASHAFLCLTCLTVLAVCFGVFLFYNYVFLAKTQDPESFATSAKFQESAYRSVLMQLQERRIIFENVSPAEYIDPFR